MHMKGRLQSIPSLYDIYNQIQLYNNTALNTEPFWTRLRQMKSPKLSSYRKKGKTHQMHQETQTKKNTPNHWQYAKYLKWLKVTVMASNYAIGGLDWRGGKISSQKG